MNISVRAVIFWDLIHWVPGLGTEWRVHRTLLFARYFFEDFIVRWTRGGGVFSRSRVLRWPCVCMCCGTTQCTVPQVPTCPPKQFRFPPLVLVLQKDNACPRFSGQARAPSLPDPQPRAHHPWRSKSGGAPVAAGDRARAAAKTGIGISPGAPTQAGPVPIPQREQAAVEGRGVPIEVHGLVPLPRISWAVPCTGSHPRQRGRLWDSWHGTAANSSVDQPELG